MPKLSKRVVAAAIVAVGVLGSLPFLQRPPVTHSEPAKSSPTLQPDPDVTLHMGTESAASPAVGLSMAALAVTSARGRTLGNGRVAAVFAVVGGLAFALAGPLLLLTKDAGFSPLFTGAAPLAEQGRGLVPGRPYGVFGAGHG